MDLTQRIAKFIQFVFLFCVDIVDIIKIIVRCKEKKKRIYFSEKDVSLGNPLQSLRIVLDLEP